MISRKVPGCQGVAMSMSSGTGTGTRRVHCGTGYLGTQAAPGTGESAWSILSSQAPSAN